MHIVDCFRHSSAAAKLAESTSFPIPANQAAMAMQAKKILLKSY
jgi:hypothetical protein